MSKTLIAIALLLCAVQAQAQTKPTISVTMNMALGCKLQSDVPALIEIARATANSDIATGMAVAQKIKDRCGVNIDEGTKATLEKLDLDTGSACISGMAPDDLIWMMEKFDGCVWVSVEDIRSFGVKR